MLNEKVCRIAYYYAMGVKPVRAHSHHTRRCLSLCVLDWITSKIRILSLRELDRLFFRLKSLLLSLSVFAIVHDEFQLWLVRVATPDFDCPCCQCNCDRGRGGWIHKRFGFRRFELQLTL